MFAPFFFILIFFDAISVDKETPHFDGYVYGVLAVLLWVVLPLIIFIL